MSKITPLKWDMNRSIPNRFVTSSKQSFPLSHLFLYIYTFISIHNKKKLIYNSKYSICTILYSICSI